MTAYFLDVIFQGPAPVVAMAAVVMLSALGMAVRTPPALVRQTARSAKALPRR